MGMVGLGRQALSHVSGSVSKLAAAVACGDFAGIGSFAIAAAACGLQNGAVSLFGGFLFRTTHLTGMATDLGLAIGHRLRGFAVDNNRLIACIVVGVGFLAGGISGGIAYARLGFASLYVPASLATAAGLAIVATGPRDV